MAHSSDPAAAQGREGLGGCGRCFQCPPRFPSHLSGRHPYALPGHSTFPPVDALTQSVDGRLALQMAEALSLASLPLFHLHTAPLKAKGSRIVE